MDELCQEKHKTINDKLTLHEHRLNDHSARLDKIEITNTRLEERLDGLITQISTLNSTLKWFMGIIIGAFVSFFFYAVQRGVL